MFYFQIENRKQINSLNMHSKPAIFFYYSKKEKLKIQSANRSNKFNSFLERFSKHKMKILVLFIKMDTCAQIS